TSRLVARPWAVSTALRRARPAALIDAREAVLDWAFDTRVESVAWARATGASSVDADTVPLLLLWAASAFVGVGGALAGGAAPRPPPPDEAEAAVGEDEEPRPRRSTTTTTVAATSRAPAAIAATRPRWLGGAGITAVLAGSGVTAVFAGSGVTAAGDAVGA